MHYISQLYGIKLDVLYKKNLMEKGSEPEVSKKLQLRKGLKQTKVPFDLKIKELQEKKEIEKEDKETELKEEDEIIFEFDFEEEE